MRHEVHYNRHHVLFARAHWEAGNATRMLRNNMGLIVPMELGAHEALHRNVTIVPVLGHYAAQNVRNELKPHHDPFVAIDGFRRAVEHANKNKHATELDRKLGELVLESIEAQMPFMREGFIDLTDTA